MISDLCLKTLSGSHGKRCVCQALGKILESSKVMASFSALGGDFPSIAWIVLQFGRVFLVVQCLHELSPCVSPMFVCCSGDQ